MRVFDNILNWIIKIASVIIMCIISAIVLLMINELFLRNIVGESFSGMTEVAGILFLWMAFLGVMILFNNNTLIALDVFVTGFNGKKKKVVDIIHQIVSFCLGVAICFGYLELYPYVSTTYYSSMPNLSKGLQYLPLLICGIFICLKSINNLIKLIINKENV